MPHVDSLDKIVTNYFAIVTREPFEWRGQQFTPRTLIVSPGLFRGYTCPEGCGGCCPRFSLDYIPGEDMPDGVEPRTIRFDGRDVVVHSDMQTDHTNPKCRHLRFDDGRCGIHGRQPFSCDFELIRASMSSMPGEANRLNTRLFGRGWAMMRVDGERGALCTITPATADTTHDVLRRLRRLSQWCDHFGLRRTVLPLMRAWVSDGPHEHPLMLPYEGDR